LIAEETTSAFILSDDVKQKIDAWREKFPPEQARSALLYALRVAQEEQGWLSEPLMDAIAIHLSVPRIAVYEVATFYTMYDLKPVGRHKIGVCTNISCLLNGSEKIAAHLQKRLGVGFNETTADGKCYLQELECLAACAGAPALIIDDKHYHEHMTIEKIDALLETLVETLE
jgi:NADH-quinone oxidoreductase subunit E